MHHNSRQPPAEVTVPSPQHLALQRHQQALAMHQAIQTTTYSTTVQRTASPPTAGYVASPAMRGQATSNQAVIQPAHSASSSSSQPLSQQQIAIQRHQQMMAQHQAESQGVTQPKLTIQQKAIESHHQLALKQHQQVLARHQAARAGTLQRAGNHPAKGVSEPKLSPQRMQPVVQKADHPRLPIHEKNAGYPELEQKWEKAIRRFLPAHHQGLETSGFFFRADDRDPSIIRATGFQPQGGGNYHDSLPLHQYRLKGASGIISTTRSLSFAEHAAELLAEAKRFAPLKAYIYLVKAKGRDTTHPDYPAHFRSEYEKHNEGVRELLHQAEVGVKEVPADEVYGYREVEWGVSEYKWSEWTFLKPLPPEAKAVLAERGTIAATQIQSLWRGAHVRQTAANAAPATPLVTVHAAASRTPAVAHVTGPQIAQGPPARVGIRGLRALAARRTVHAVAPRTPAVAHVTGPPMAPAPPPPIVPAIPPLVMPASIATLKNTPLPLRSTRAYYNRLKAALADIDRMLTRYQGQRNEEMIIAGWYVDDVLGRLRWMRDQDGAFFLIYLGQYHNSIRQSVDLRVNRLMH